MDLIILHKIKSPQCPRVEKILSAINSQLSDDNRESDRLALKVIIQLELFEKEGVINFFTLLHQNEWRSILLGRENYPLVDEVMSDVGQLSLSTSEPELPSINSPREEQTAENFQTDTLSTPSSDKSADTYLMSLTEYGLLSHSEPASGYPVYGKAAKALQEDKSYEAYIESLYFALSDSFDSNSHALYKALTKARSFTPKEYSSTLLHRVEINAFFPFSEKNEVWFYYLEYLNNKKDKTSAEMRFYSQIFGGSIQDHAERRMADWESLLITSDMTSSWGYDPKVSQSIKMIRLLEEAGVPHSKEWIEACERLGCQCENNVYYVKFYIPKAADFSRKKSQQQYTRLGCLKRQYSPSPQRHKLGSTNQPLQKSAVEHKKPSYKWPKQNLIRLQEINDAYMTQTPITIGDDRVECSRCGGALNNWEKGDIAANEHLWHFPECPYIIQRIKKEQLSGLNITDYEVCEGIKEFKSKITEQGKEKSFRHNPDIWNFVGNFLRNKHRIYTTVP